MKLSLDALKERAEATASTELLAAITGGNENSCHVDGITVTIEIKPAPEGTATVPTTFRF